MATAETRLLTIEDWNALTEGRPYVEFEDGEFIPMPSPTPEHQDIVRELGSRVWHFVRHHNLGRLFTEVDVFLPDGKGYVPVLSFLSAARLDLLDTADRKIHGSPDLVGEVTSSDPSRDREHKFRVYHANSVKWYWLVDREALVIEEYQHTPQGYRLVASAARSAEFQSKAFLGFTVNLASLLA